MNKVIAAVNPSFGPAEIIELKELPFPIAGDDEFILKGEFASVSTGDVRIRSKNIPKGFKFMMGLIFGFNKPKYQSLGTDYVGQVIQLGKNVEGLKLGDRVVADLGMKLNGHQNFRVIHRSETWQKVPDSITSELAVSSVFGGLTALIFLRDKLKIQPGEQIFITGAGGAVGSSAVQIAQFFGAQVVALCSTKKKEIVSQLGAHQVICYEEPEWQKNIGQFDAVLDCVGLYDIDSSKKVLKTQGRICFIVADLFLNFKCPFISLISDKKYIAGPIQGTRKDLSQLLDLIQNKKLKPLIGDQFPFNKIVDAHKNVESGHKLGTTLIQF